jgi:diaminopimelate decarboxylase
MEAIDEFIPQGRNLMLVLEPGRGLVGESGRLLATVVGKAKRGDAMWLYLDAGVFNGLMETYEGFPPVVSLLNEPAEYETEPASNEPFRASHKTMAP